MSADGVTVLLVDDDEIDTEAILRAFRRHELPNRIEVARNGIEALEALRGTPERPRIRRPYLILLDLNMPRMGGLELLEELRRDPNLRDSVVFVLTTSNADRDIAAAYAGRVAGYVVKGRAGEDYEHLIELLRRYWNLVRLPVERHESADEAAAAAAGWPRSVLLVDDSALDAELLRRTLAECLPHARLTHVLREEEVLDTLDGHPYDVVLLDNRLVVLTGVEVLAQLRAAGHRHPVVLFTGQVEGVPEELASLDCDVLLDKNELTPEGLQAALERVRPGAGGEVERTGG